jgi:integrase
VRAVVAAAQNERDRLLLRTLWATGARISEVLALRPMDVQHDHLGLPNLKNPSVPVKRVFLPAAQADLSGALLLWAKKQHLAEHAPLFFSRKHSADGGLRAISRVQGWEIVKAASLRADVQVLALRSSRHGAAGQPVPVHPHLFRHARVRQIGRTTKNLPLAQRQAGCRWPTFPSAMMRRAHSRPRSMSNSSLGPGGPPFASVSARSAASTTALCPTVEGRLRNSHWEQPDGTKRERTELVATSVKPLS